MQRAPESLSWWRSSRAVYSGLTLTTTSPARKMPHIATGYCSTFGSMIATRSPRVSPSVFCRKQAKFIDSRFRSAYVRVFPRFEYAGLSG